MNKYLLTTGLGMLFLSTVIAQNKITYDIPRSISLPLPANSSVKAIHHLFVDDHLARKDDQLIALTDTGDTLFAAGWKRNQLMGNWSSWYRPQQMIDSGRLEKSVPDGEWKTWYPDGTLRTIRTYHAEKLAYIKNEIRRKEARNTFYVLTDIARTNTSAANHLMTASYSYHSFDNPTANTSGQQMNSLEQRVKQNAVQTSYLPPFTACLHHGLYMNFFPGGNAKDSGYYKNGVRDGLWREWNADASVLATGMYKRGRPSGDWKFFNRQGRMLYIELYDSRGKLKEVIKRKI